MPRCWPGSLRFVRGMKNVKCKRMVGETMCLYVGPSDAVYMKKRRGPRTDSWGTPWPVEVLWIPSHSRQPWKTYLWDKDLNQWSGVSVMSIDERVTEESDDLKQGSATYGTCANSGMQRDNRWHASNRENCIVTQGQRYRQSRRLPRASGFEEGPPKPYPLCPLYGSPWTAKY